MTGVAITLVIFSAVLHAGWNYFNKGSADRWAFFLGQGVTTAILCAPAFLWFWPRTHIAPLGWFCIAGSAATHAAYAVYLLKSYDAGDLSVAYPLSRTAPVLVVGWDVLTARGQLTAAGVLGALLSGLGALVLQLPALRAHGGRAVLGDPVTRYSLVTAAFIAVYTIIDKQGVQHVHPFIFLYLCSFGEYALIAVQLGGTVRLRVATELRRNAWTLVVTAIVGPFSYFLILWVLTSAPASYVLGLRQISIVFGVLLGRFLLGEGETTYRLAGAGIIATGSVLIAVGG